MVRASQPALTSVEQQQQMEIPLLAWNGCPFPASALGFPALLHRRGALNFRGALPLRLWERAALPAAAKASASSSVRLPSGHQPLPASTPRRRWSKTATFEIFSRARYSEAPVLKTCLGRFASILRLINTDAFAKRRRSPDGCLVRKSEPRRRPEVIK